MKETMSDNKLSGTLVDHGKAPWDNNPKESPSYFATIEKENGEKNTSWGVDIERAIKDGEIKIGDNILLKREGRVAVEVPQKIMDEEGNVIGSKTIETHRNTWSIKKQEQLTRPSELKKENITIKPNPSEDLEKKQQKENEKESKYAIKINDVVEQFYQLSDSMGSEAERVQRAIDIVVAGDIKNIGDKSDREKFINRMDKEGENIKKAVTSELNTVFNHKKEKTLSSKARSYNEESAKVRVEELKARPIDGNFSASHIRRINKYVVQDSNNIKGGAFRKDEGDQVRLRRVHGTDDFFKMPYAQGVIKDKTLNGIMAEFGSVKDFSKKDKEVATEKLSNLYSKLEKLGAFEAGNNKTARVYIEQIAEKSGFIIDWSKVNQYERERAKSMDRTINIQPVKKQEQLHENMSAKSKPTAYSGATYNSTAYTVTGGFTARGHTSSVTPKKTKEKVPTATRSR